MTSASIARAVVVFTSAVAVAAFGWAVLLVILPIVAASAVARTEQ